MNWTRAVLTAAIGLVSSILGAYFVWLGFEVNAIGKKVERLDVNVEAIKSKMADPSPRIER